MPPKGRRLRAAADYALMRQQLENEQPKKIVKEGITTRRSKDAEAISPFTGKKVNLDNLLINIRTHQKKAEAKENKAIKEVFDSKAETLQASKEMYDMLAGSKPSKKQHRIDKEMQAMIADSKPSAEISKAEGTAKDAREQLAKIMRKTHVNDAQMAKGLENLVKRVVVREDINKGLTKNAKEERAIARAKGLIAKMAPYTEKRAKEEKAIEDEMKRLGLHPSDKKDYLIGLDEKKRDDLKEARAATRAMEGAADPLGLAGLLDGKGYELFDVAGIPKRELQYKISKMEITPQEFVKSLDKEQLAALPQSFIDEHKTIINERKQKVDRKAAMTDKFDNEEELKKLRIANAKYNIDEEETNMIQPGELSVLRMPDMVRQRNYVMPDPDNMADAYRRRLDQEALNRRKRVKIIPTNLDEGTSQRISSKMKTSKKKLFAQEKRVLTPVSIRELPLDHFRYQEPSNSGLEPQDVYTMLYGKKDPSTRAMMHAMFSSGAGG